MRTFAFAVTVSALFGLTFVHGYRTGYRHAEAKATPPLESRITPAEIEHRNKQ